MKKLKIFIAAPLFNEMERQRNLEIKNLLQQWGYDTFLAQEDVGLSYSLFENEKQKQLIRKTIFEEDITFLRGCDIILILLDGRTPDEGACVEVGIGWALGKKCIMFKTDERAMDHFGDNNIMIDGCCDFTVNTNLDELKDRLLSLSKLFNVN